MQTRRILTAVIAAVVLAVVTAGPATADGTGWVVTMAVDVGPAQVSPHPDESIDPTADDDQLPKPVDPIVASPPHSQPTHHRRHCKRYMWGRCMRY